MDSKSDYTILRSVMDIIEFLLHCLIIIIKAIVLFFLPDSFQHRKNLEKDIALITGGGSGLGRLVALRLARLGVVVVLWDINYEGALETANQVKDFGGKAYVYKCDLASKDDIYKVASQTRQDVGEISLLINNAGVVSGQLLLDTPDHLIKRSFDVNILAHFWTTKAFLPEMVRNNRGHIVTIASMAGHVGINKLVDYCSSKFAAVGFSESLRVELEEQGVEGVKTTVICPYFIQSTGMFGNVKSRFVNTLKSTDVADRIIEAIRKEEVAVYLPSLFQYAVMFKYFVPWECISMFLRGLVPDAAPSSSNFLTKKTAKNDVLNNLGFIKSTVASLDDCSEINGKQL